MAETNEQAVQAARQVTPEGDDEINGKPLTIQTAKALRLEPSLTDCHPNRVQATAVRNAHQFATQIAPLSTAFAFCFFCCIVAASSAAGA